MRFASLLAVALIVPACAGGGGSGVPASPPPKEPLLAVVWEDDVGTLAQLDPASLRPLRGPRVALEGYGGPWALSPDGSRVAFGGKRSVRLIDVKRMQVLGDVELGGMFVAAVAWPREDRVLVSFGSGDPSDLRLAVIDTALRRVVAQRTVPGASLTDSAATQNELVLLLITPNVLGSADLALFDVRGNLRVIDLAEVPAGWEAAAVADAPFPVDRYQNPGLAVDSESRRAFVASSQHLVAEVDLRTMAVRYHRLRPERSVLGRLREWVEPAAEAKGASDGSYRDALWLGDGRLAMSGWDDDASLDEDGNWHETTTPAGLALIDTEDWSTRMLFRDAAAAEVIGETLLAYADVYNGNSPSGIGLRGFTLDGERRFHLLDEQPITDLAAVGSHAYLNVDSAWCEIAVVDVDAGRVVRDVEAWEEQCSWPTILGPAR